MRSSSHNFPRLAANGQAAGWEGVWEIVRDLDLTSNQVWGLTETDEEWSTALDVALMATRQDDLEHGTNAAYVAGRVCKGCRGTSGSGWPRTGEPASYVLVTTRRARHGRQGQVDSVAVWVQGRRLIWLSLRIGLRASALQHTMHGSRATCRSPRPWT